MINIPPLVRLTIAEAAEAVRQNAKHQLSRDHYTALLQSFGPLIDLSGGQSFFRTRQAPSPPGFRAYGRIAMLTAEHVLPIWEEGINQLFLSGAEFPYSIHLPHSMLAQAQAVLEQRADLEQIATQLSNDLYFAMAGLRLYVPYRVFYAAAAAEAALSIVLGGSSQWGEMTDAACRAASVINHTKTVDEWKTMAVSSDPDHALYRSSDAEHAFWEWWLWEAIPHAWEEGT